MNHSTVNETQLTTLINSWDFLRWQDRKGSIIITGLKIPYLTSSSQMTSSSIHTLDQTLMDNKRALRGLCLWKDSLTLPCSSFSIAAMVVIRTGKQKNQENLLQKLRTGSQQLLRHIWPNHSNLFHTASVTFRLTKGSLWHWALREIVGHCYYIPWEP